MSVGIHQDIHTQHWVVACTDHGMLWDCASHRDAQDLAYAHRGEYHAGRQVNA